jgi:hypothetical protein
MLDAFAHDFTPADKSEQFLTLDVIGDLAFGEPFDCLRDSTYHPRVSMINNSIRFITFAQALAYYLHLQITTRHLIPPSFKRAVQFHLAMTGEKVLRRKATKVDRNDLISNFMVSWINFLFLECRIGLVSLLLLLRRYHPRLTLGSVDSPE